ncbi:MAG: trypsin-like peptidase domain-containing protein [Elusimicrobiota bacterium]
MNALLLALAFALPRPAAASQARALQEEFAAIARRCMPAVVNISTVREEEVQVPLQNYMFGSPEDLYDYLNGPPQGRTFRQRSGGVGSGFIIDAAGHVVTNDHVVRDAVDIRVTLTRPDGAEETLKGRVVGRDPNLDLAVVRIEARREFPSLRLADSDKVRVGDWAIAVGSPFSLEQTLTVGVISAVRQSLSIEGRPYPNLLQTDAAINQGNSGGPLLDVDGEVLGVNTAIFSPSGASAGIGFAIPANELKLALEYLLAGRQSPVGWLGVEAAPLDEVFRRRFRLPSTSGVILNAVVPDGPAAKAGLRRGDVILGIDGKPAASPQDLVARITRIKPGTPVKMDLYRGGKPLALKVRIGLRPDAEAAAPPPSGAAPAGEEHAGQEWEGVVFESSAEGVRVARISSDSPLRGTLREGDVLRGIDAAAVASLDDLRAAAPKADFRRGIVFDIVRRGRPLYLSVSR